MRTKNFLITLCVVVSVSLVFIISGQHKPESIQNFVSTTNEQIQNFKDNLRDAETKTLNADEKYLNLLGFTDEPRLFPKDIWKNTSLPIVVTYVLDGQESQAIGLINNVANIIPNNTVLIYNLGLGDYALKTLLNYCNSSRCQVVTFDLSEFPEHVESETLHAFRPLIIQDSLRHAGAIFFLECHYRLLKNVTQNAIIKLYEDRAKKYGILAWPLELKIPVTSLTHKKMIEYFHTDAECFFFLQMVKADVLFIVNTDSIHKEIMLPWVQCALTPYCICPIGAQPAGCRNKKPLYKYWGCHGYDTSALNMVLGLKFKQDSTHYTYSGSDNYFETVPLSKALALLRELEQNSTTEGRSLPFDS